MNITTGSATPVPEAQVGIALLFFFACLLVVMITGISLFGKRTTACIRWSCEGLYLWICLRCCSCCSRARFYDKAMAKTEDFLVDEKETTPPARDYIAEINAI